MLYVGRIRDVLVIWHYKMIFFAKTFAHIKKMLYLCSREFEKLLSTITVKSHNSMIFVEL